MARSSKLPKDQSVSALNSKCGTLACTKPLLSSVRYWRLGNSQ